MIESPELSTNEGFHMEAFGRCTPSKPFEDLDGALFFLLGLCYLGLLSMWLLHREDDFSLFSIFRPLAPFSLLFSSITRGRTCRGKS